MPGILSVVPTAFISPADTALVDRGELLSGQQAILEWGGRWREIQRANSALSSPYYSLEFADAVSKVRPFEAIAMYGNNLLLGLWPFHRVSGNRGIPLASALNDYHGPLAVPNIRFDPKQILAVARLSRLDFHSLAWPQQLVQDYTFHQELDRSWIELGKNGDEYIFELMSRSSRIARQAQKTRRCERELGPLKLEFSCPDAETIDWVIDQKREKYRRTGCTDFFKQAWTRDLLHELTRVRSSSFRTICSVLYAGEHRLAAHFGISYANVLHYWYPVFDSRFAKYSPGLEMFLRIMGDCRDHGIEVIDFGYGEEDYKRTLASHWGKVAVGSLERFRPRFVTNRFVENTRLRLKRSRFRQMIRDAARVFWPTLGKPKVS